jgi:hypothetical protein
MRKMNIFLLVIGAIVIFSTAMTWLAIGGWKQIGTHFEDDTSSPAAISEIHVTGTSVEVQVRPSATSGVEVHRTARYLNPFHNRPGPTSRIDGGVLTLGGDDGCTFCVIEYVVEAPAGVRVTGEVTSGSLDLSGVSTVDVKTTSGSVTITDATGDVNARTGSGSIIATGLRSGVVASTGSGSLSLALMTPASVQATTSSGSLDLTVPASAYRVQTTSGSGGADIGIANDPNGRFLLALQAGSGHIKLATS